MTVLACGLAAILIWAAFFFFSFRGIISRTKTARESDISFELQAAPWSDYHVESLLAGSPRSAVLLQQYVANAIRRKDWPEALRRAEIFAVRLPRSPGAWTARIDALRGLGREEEALALLRQALRRLPREPEILAAWAYEAVRRKDWAEVVRRFEPLRRRAPQRIDGYQVPADALIEDGRPDEAEALIAEGLQRQSEDWMMWQAAARTADRLGKHNESVLRWEAMRARFPAESAGFLHGAEALARADRGEEAAALIRQARDFFPGNKEIAETATRLIPPDSEEPARRQP